MAGTAEQIPLPDASVDAVLVGQALHWFDHEQALPEIGRVLRPGGVLAGLWNDDDLSVDWVRQARPRRTSRRPASGSASAASTCRSSSGRSARWSRASSRTPSGGPRSRWSPRPPRTRCS